jgi:hypothetical protein
VKRLVTAICIPGLPWLMRAKTSTLALGTVTDPSGGAISGAIVTLPQAETGINRTDLTTGTGDYNFPLVSPGLYSVGVAVPGFKVETSRFPVAPTGGGWYENANA